MQFLRQTRSQWLILTFAGVFALCGISTATAAVNNLVFGPPYAAASSADHSTAQQFTGAGSWSKTYPAPKFEMYIDPVAQFGATFTIGEIQSINYHTINDGTNPSGVDFYLLIYTDPYVGGDASWYGNRLNAEPYLSNGYVPPSAWVWNTWNTDPGADQLTFFDANHCGNFGFYGAPTMQDLQAGPIIWASYPGAGPGADPNPIDYASQPVKYLNISTGSGWPTFSGNVDAIEIHLTNGESYLIDLESNTDPVYVDDDWAGLPLGVEVEPGKFMGFNAFAAIQDGIDNVSGSTVIVSAGTYREQLSITSSLDLTGAGMGMSIIEAPDAVSRSTYSITQWTGSARTIDAIIGVNGAGTVNISGFTVDGRDTGPNNFYGIHYFNTDGSVTNCEITNVTYSASPGSQRVVNLVATHGAGMTTAIDFSGNVMPNFQKGGILVMGPGATFTVNGNQVTNVPSPNIAGNGIQLSYGATGTTAMNIVEGAAYTGADWAATGILLFESGDISMDGDEVRNCQSGVNFSDWGWVYNSPVPVNLTFANLNLHGNEWTLGIQLSRDNSDVNMTMDDCDILSSLGDGIDFYATGVDPWGGTYYSGWNHGDLNATVNGCVINGTTLDGIWGGDYSGNANNVSIAVTNCSFAGNVGSAINNDFTQMLDASGCYWNDVAGPTVTGVKANALRPVVLAPRPFGQDLPTDGPVAHKAASMSSSGETISANVDYTPWLGGGSATTPGFNGDFSELWVDDDSPQAGADNRVQEGANLVTASTVNILPGNYPGQVVIDGFSGLNLVGSGMGATMIEAPVAAMTHFFTTGSHDNYAIISVENSSDVAISQMTIDGLGRGNSNYRFVGIGYRNSGGSADFVEVRDIRDTPFGGSQHGVGVYANNDDGTSRSVTVSNSDIHDFQKNGMALTAGATTPLVVDVHDNTVTGYGATDITAQNGIEVWASMGTGMVANNTVSGIAYDNTSSSIKWVATTILNLFANLAITGNDLSQGHVGVYSYDGAGTISGNQIAVEKVGVFAWGIIASDPPKAVPSAFGVGDITGGIGHQTMGVDALLTVSVSDNVLSFSGPDNTDTYGIEADGGYGPDDLDVTIDNNLVTDFGNGIEIWECGSGCDVGVYTNIAVTNNRLWNTINGFDNSTGGLSFWNHNCYSDLTANAGFPPNYDVSGPAGAIDVDPDLECCYYTDNEPPVITSCPGDVVVQCMGDVPPCDPGAVVATDNIGDVFITCDDATPGPGGSGGCGTVITRTYTVADSCGNTATCEQLITVDDTTDPTISCPSDLTVQQFLDLPPCDPNDATADDNCGIAQVICERSNISGVGCTDTQIDVVYTYTAVDICGNTAVCQRTVTVVRPDCPFPDIAEIVSTADCTCPCHGDPACDGVMNVLDVVQIVNVAFRGQAAETDSGCNREQTDVGCDGVTNVLDVVKVVNVAFRGMNPATQFCAPCGK